MEAIIGIVCFILWLYGILTGWRAHILLGLVAIFVPPFGVLCGAAKVVNYDLPVAIVKAVKNE